MNFKCNIELQYFFISVKIKNYQADHWDYALLGGSDAVTAGFHVHLQHFKALEQLGWAPRRQSGYLD